MKVLIEEKELRGLLEDRQTLRALEAGGVENWDWYGDSMQDFYDELLVENQLEKFKEETNSDVKQ